MSVGKNKGVCGPDDCERGMGFVTSDISELRSQGMGVNRSDKYAPRMGMQAKKWRLYESENELGLTRMQSSSPRCLYKIGIHSKLLGADRTRKEKYCTCRCHYRVDSAV